MRFKDLVSKLVDKVGTLVFTIKFDLHVIYRDLMGKLEDWLLWGQNKYEMEGGKEIMEKILAGIKYCFGVLAYVVVSIFAKLRLNMYVKTMERGMSNDEYDRQHDGDESGRGLWFKIKLVAKAVLIVAFIISWNTTGKFLTIMATLNLLSLYINYIYFLNRGIYDFKWCLKYINKTEPNLSPMRKYYWMPVAMVSHDTALEMGYDGANLHGSTIRKDDKYGWVREMYIDLKVPARNLSDELLTEYGLIPVAPSELATNAYYSKNGVALQSIEFLNDKLSLDELTNLIATDESLWNTMPELKQFAKRQKEENQQADLIAKREAFRKELETTAQDHNLPDEYVKIMMVLNNNRDSFGFAPWRIGTEGLVANKNYLKIRMRILNGFTFEKIKNNKEIKAKLRKQVMFSEVPSDTGSFFLEVILNTNLKPKKMSFDDVIADGNAGLITVGTGQVGEVQYKLPREDDPLFTLIGGISRSGKSTFANRFISTLLYLNDGAGNYDYSDVFISSVKPEDYISNGYQASGMLVEGEPLKIYEMLKQVDAMATARQKTFIANNTINIKQYNKKSTDKMGKILVIMDEYANTLSKADNDGLKTEDGRKLSDAIQGLAMKIAQEHGSRGVSLIVITQKFNKSGVGDLFDALGSKFLGFAPANVWNSIDNTQVLANHMKSMENERKGLFFVQNDWETTQPVTKIADAFVESRTNFIDTDAIRKGFDRKFTTADEYGGVELAPPLRTDVFKFTTADEYGGVEPTAEITAGDEELFE